MTHVLPGGPQYNLTVSPTVNRVLITGVAPTQQVIVAPNSTTIKITKERNNVVLIAARQGPAGPAGAPGPPGSSMVSTPSVLIGVGLTGLVDSYTLTGVTALKWHVLVRSTVGTGAAYFEVSAVQLAGVLDFNKSSILGDIGKFPVSIVNNAGVAEIRITNNYTQIVSVSTLRAIIV